MKITILAIFLGVVLLFGCTGQTNTAPAPSANTQPSGQGQTNIVANPTTVTNQTAAPENYTIQLWGAVDHNDTALAKSSIDKGADVNAKDSLRTVLMYALQRQCPDIAKLLIENGADVNSKDSYGRSPLIYAEGNGYADIVKLLIDKGADVNAKDKNGKTVLTYASQDGHADIVQILKDAGAK